MQKVGSIAFYPSITNCALTNISEKSGDFHDHVVDKSYNTQSPRQAFVAAERFFSGHRLDALCIIMYGIVDEENRTFQGSTQQGWTQAFSIAEYCRAFIGEDIVSTANVICSNDSAAAAVAEYVWGAGCQIGDEEPGRTDIVYFGVLDGIGSGIIQNGKLWNGYGQPEMGHLPVRRYVNTINRRSGRDSFPGICPHHQDCVEGLASQFALAERMKTFGFESMQELIAKPDHTLWDMQAYYLAELAVSAGMILSPRRIIFGGPSIHDTLISRTRTLFDEQISKYPSYLKDRDRNYIARSAFGGKNAPLYGGLELARQSLNNRLTGSPSILKNKRKLVRNSRASPFDQDVIQAQKTEEEFNFSQVRLGKPFSKRKIVFGLSITETVQWAIAASINGHLVGGEYIAEGECGQIPESTMPFDRSPSIQIQRELSEALNVIGASHGELLKEVEGIGVSAIGVCDPETKRLVSIARKKWVSEDPSYLIDFKRLFLSSGLFPKLKEEQIEVQNDASARCLTEYYYGSQSKSDDGAQLHSLMYLMVGEGVNGAVIREGGLPHMIGHPEMGHQLPQAHILDLIDEEEGREILGKRHAYFKAFDERRHTGCPKHLRCFEGVASRARIRAQWGEELEKLPPHHIAWEIQASYLSQFAMNAVLTHDPDRLLFAGHMFNRRPSSAGRPPKAPELIELVRLKFLKQNAGYLPKYASPEAVEKLIALASLGEEIKIKSALVMACVGASSSDRASSDQTILANFQIIQAEKHANDNPPSERKR